MKLTKVILQLFFIALLIGVLGITNMRHKSNKCQDYKINLMNNTPSFLTHGDVLLMIESEVDSIIGYPINQLPLHSIEMNIENKSSIENAEVYISLDNCLHVEVQQKNPIVRVKQLSGQEFYMDRNGAIFDLSLNHTERILVANGHIKDSLDLRKVHQLAKHINSIPFWKSQIVQIYVDAQRDIELIPRVGNHTILLGGIDDYKGKFKKLKLFYERGVQQTGWNNYQQINLKYKDQIVCVKK